MFVYQLTPDILELKKTKVLIKLSPLYTTFLNSRKLSRYRTRIKFDNSVLVAEQNNYASKIVYDLDIFLKTRCSCFTLKICLLNVQEKFVYSGYGIAYNERWSGRSFNNDFARNVIIFGFDNSSSSHSNNQNTDCLVLGEGPTYSINGSFALSRKKV